jgi:hypothetical protein
MCVKQVNQPKKKTVFPKPINFKHTGTGYVRLLFKSYALWISSEFKTRNVEWKKVAAHGTKDPL